MTVRDILNAAKAVSAAAGCAVEEDTGREIELVNLAAAELWGLSEAMREARGLEPAEYGEDARVVSPDDEMKTDDGIYPALTYYLAASLILPDAPIMSGLLRELGNEAAEDARRNVSPSRGRIREVYGL